MFSSLAVLRVREVRGVAVDRRGTETSLGRELLRGELLMVGFRATSPPSLYVDVDDAVSEPFRHHMTGTGV
jgi:hypothetical protein